MKYLWFFLACLLLAAIYYNSSLPLRQSAQLSGWATALAQLLASHLDVHLVGNTEHHIRKLAHFLELRCWGFCCAAASAHLA